MAPVICFIRLIRPGTRAIPRTSARIVLQGEEARLLDRRCAACCRRDLTRGWMIRSQSTKTHTQHPQSQPKSRTSKKTTVDIIRVAEEIVCEDKATVTRVNQHSFNHTLGGIPKAPSVTVSTSKASHSVEKSLPAQNLFDQEEIFNEKFKDLISSRVESSWTCYPKINEEVRWSRGMSHTYDSTFSMNDIISDGIETCEVKFNDVNYAQDIFGIDELVEKSETLELPDRDLLPLSSPLSGFADASTVPQPENIESVGAVKKLTKKEKTGMGQKDKKVVSTKKKTKAVTTKQKGKTDAKRLKDTDMTSSKAKVKQVSSKSKSKQSSRKLFTGDHHEVAELLSHELDMEEIYARSVEEVIVKSPVSATEKVLKGSKQQKKLKGEEKHKKYLKEIRRRGRESSFNQTLAAYVCVCVNLGMLNRATHTLLYYRQRARHVTNSCFSQKINTIQPYNIVILGHAEKGNFRKMEELLKCLKEDDITPDETTYAAMLTCLGKQQESSANSKNIQACLDDMQKEGIDVQNLFSKVDFIRDGYECTLRAIRRVSPSFEPQQVIPPIGFSCNLVSQLNKTLHTTKVSSPAHGVVTMKELSEWTEEQFDMEAKSELVVNSIEWKEDSKDTNNYRKMLEYWEGRWQKVLRQTFLTQVDVLKKSFFSQRLDKRMTLYPYLVTLPPDEFVNIMVQEISRLARGSESYSLSRYAVYRRLGELVFSRYLVQYKKEVGVLDKLKSVYDEYISWYLNNNREDGVTYVPRVRWQELASSWGSGPNVEHGPVEWPSTVMVSIGKFLFTMIFVKVMLWNPLLSKKHAYPVLYEVERVKGYRVVDEIKPSPSLVELYQKAAKPTLTFESIVSPMVCPPIPWVSTKIGGYLLNDAKIVRLPYSAHLQKQRMEECGNQQLYPVMDSLNQLSTIPWRINKPILDIIIQLFNGKGCDELDIPQPPSECPEPQKIQSGMSKSEIHKIRRQRLEYEQKKGEMHSLWCDALYKLSLAHHFRDRVFWFPHNMDFRGRVYPCPPHLNHLSSDVFRSVLKFARGEKLGPNGLRWLKLHLANLTGFVKRDSVEDRIKYCEDVLEDIFDSADKPLTGRRWWTKSDEPWQTLAACMELAAALRSDDPADYVSHLPIHQDGSCNGLQHYAALGRDKIGAVSVNLAPSRVPQDVYSAVAALVEKERVKDADLGHEIARALQGHVKRKVIKQTVMTTVYGVTRYGARLQIEKQLKALDNFPPEQRWAASHYLVNKTFFCLEKMFTATKEIQTWFTDCAKIVSETCGENLEYVTPLGLPVVQPYSRHVGNQASVTKLPTSFSMDSYMRPNVMKQKNAFPPNFIHSLDSSHMMLTSLYCQQAGITFISIHDCFWTHASSVDIMNKICREQFVALHKEPILDDLSKFLQRRFRVSYRDFAHDGSALDSSKMKLNNLMCQVPTKGEFDISSVLKSLYFFS
ncbi:DNA-directed RNA polymerase, mitochondrial [Panulirus ornatus]|uniref:DNA-directed RNA polymerase, mitochondrial n=1 Tax=Panulirus ornatus TaxID=150431 RepID=UPI003A862A63